MKNLTMPNSLLKFKLLVILSCLIAVTSFTYWNTLNYDFLSWDSEKYVLENPFIREFSWANLTTMFTEFYASYWCPLTWLSFAVDYHFFGEKPWGYHFTNVLFHNLNVIAFFFFILVIFNFSQHQNISLKNTKPLALFAATLAAAIFAIHPLNIESVVWVAERKNVLTQFFTLLTLLSYVIYVASTTTRTKVIWYLSSLLCFILALLAKPMVVTLPVVLLLMDVYPLNRTRLTVFATPTTLVSYTRLLLEKLPFFLLTGTVIIITILAQHGKAGTGLDVLSLDIRLFNLFNSLTLYIAKYLFPISLSPFYTFSSISSYGNFNSYIPIIAFFLVTFISIYSWYKKHYYILIAWIFYLVTLSPTLGIIQVGPQSAADRFTYFPLLAFHILVGLGIAFGYYHYQERRYKIFSISILTACLLFGALLVQLNQRQSTVWQNDIIFWNYINLTVPDTPLVKTNLGAAYLKKGERKKALALFREAAQLSNDGAIYFNLIQTYLSVNKIEEAKEVYAEIKQRRVDMSVEKLSQHEEPELYSHLIKIYLALAEPDEAVKVLDYAQQHAINDIVRDPYLHIALAESYFQKKMYRNSLIYMANAIKFSKDWGTVGHLLKTYLHFSQKALAILFKREEAMPISATSRE